MNKKQPKLTVITVTYNLVDSGRVDYFRQCLESVHNQTYKEIEHIIIDGNSKDGSLFIIREYAEKGWIKYISEKDDGIYHAMNKGIKLAKGEYVAFLNSDDYWHNIYGVEESIKVLEKEKADFCGSDAIFIDVKNIKRSFVGYADLNKIFVRMPFCHQTMFCKTQVMIREGMFDLDFKSSADYDFLIRLYLKKYKGAVVNCKLATFRMGGESFINYKIGQDECLKILKKHFNKHAKITNDQYKEWLFNSKIPIKIKPYLDKFLYKENKKNSPKVSIITVSYNLVKSNRIKSFEKAIESVRNQTYKNIEHIVVDGGSKDGTLEIIEEYAKKGWIKYISEKDEGIYFAMQRGVRISTGDYCYFLNTDDQLYDDMVVEDVMNKFEETRFNAIDAIYGDIYAYSIDKKVPYTKVFELNAVNKFDSIKSKRCLLHNNIHHQAIFYSRKIFENSSFFSPNIKEGSDWKFNCDAFIKNGHLFLYLPRTVAKFNMGGVSTQVGVDVIEEFKKLNNILIEEYSCYIPEGNILLDNNAITSDKNENSNSLALKNSPIEKKFYLFGIMLLKIKKRNKRKKIYLFGFLPIYRASKKVPVAYKLETCLQMKDDLEAKLSILVRENTNLSNNIADKNILIENYRSLINEKEKLISNKENIINRKDHLLNFYSNEIKTKVDHIYKFISDIKK